MAKSFTLTDILKALVLASGLFFTSPLIGQYLYVSTDHNDIYRIENDYSLTYITTANYPKTLTDIAITPSGKLYGIASQDIVEINLQTGDVNFLFQLLGYDSSNSLTCSNENKLYLRGDFSNVLYAFDLADSSMRLINYLGSDQTDDITFYRGNILYQSLYKYEIRVYDIQEQTFVKIACHLTSAFMQGMSSVMDSCGLEHVYMIDQGSRFFEINFATHQTEQVFNFWTPDRKFLGMASVSEYRGSVCYSHPDSVECENIVGLELLSTNTYLNVYPIPTQDYITIECSFEIEGLKIYNVSGTLVKFIHQPMQTVDVTDLANGIYLLQVYSGQKSMFQKIIVL